MTDPLRDYLASIDWQAFDDRLPDLCCDHLRSFLRYPDPLERLTEVYPACTQQAKAAQDLLDAELVYGVEQAMAKAAELVKQARRKWKGEGR